MKRRHLEIPVLFVVTISLSAVFWTVSDVRSAPEQRTGTVKGTVHFDGKVPKARFPDDLGFQRPLLAVDSKTTALQFAVVYLQGADEDSKALVKGGSKGVPPPSPARGDGEAEDPLPPVLVDQLDMTFIPHLIAVREGQPVHFANNDAANHNVRSAALDRRNQFNVLTPVDGSHKRVFYADAKQRPIRLGCEIHGWMRAWIYVFDHPYFAVTDAKGQFSLDHVPPGKYVLKLRQPDGGLQADREITLTPDKPVTLDFRFTEKDLNVL